ncbi:MAG: GNAT family N-acetyltransferase [Ardenticatenaceae bacterium]|nr:GNAT family N-acetyltransferase [Anaerolineales bacterium]MCB8920221.1 GNAT family N-acetyltransferase [Ardenticatenaceae bacterium]MCB9004893.1 GNAT family N-acetyltransferase [Ardenticatenaceae bacterium]
MMNKNGLETMEFAFRICNEEDDFWRVRNFLRGVFLLNDRLEHSWHVARLDYWRWHYIKTCNIVEAVGNGMAFWENADGEMIAALNHLGGSELRLHVHPHFRSAKLENEMLSYAEENFYAQTEDGRRYIYMPIFEDDTQRQEIAQSRGYEKRSGWGHHYRRDLDSPIPDVPIPSGYAIRSMGGADEFPARSWASWRAFHNDEPDENYDGDYSWYANLQSAPLYRRDLDVVAAAPDGRIAAFCTSFYDDYTRSAVTVLVGTAFEYWRRGLAKAVMTEGLRRLREMGCTRVFSTAYEEPADFLYRSVLREMKVTDTWLKVLK